LVRKAALAQAGAAFLESQAGLRRARPAGWDDTLSFTLEQTGRFLTLEFDGAVTDKYVPIGFHGSEGLSQISRYVVDVVSKDFLPDPKSVLGHSVTVVVTIADVTRRFTGIVSRFSPGPLWGRGYRTFQFEFMPKLWLTMLNSRCRSFLGKTALDIVHDVLTDYGISESTRGPGAGSRAAREYCLQYCESDYAFMSRLLEEEGLFFYFPLDHQNNSIVLVDGVGGAFDIGSSDLEVGPHATIGSWSQDLRTVVQKVTYSGYDFTQASIVSKSASAATRLDYAAGAAVEVYPSNVIDDPRSQFHADMHIQALEADYETFSGSCHHPKFAPGGRTSIIEGRGSTESKSVMLVTIDHQAICNTHVSADDEVSEYSNQFTCIPLDTKYRPPRHTQRRLIHGPQTATVSSDPDKYGRVKVKFHWGNQIESWWARIAMPWAHNQMGFQFLPRTGSEVVVQFLDGIPERPIIVGAVYNGVNTNVYSLPDNKTQSGMRGTDPDKTGAAEQFNELQFEDKSGEEFIKLFAQKDFHRVVVNNDTLEVRQGDRTVVVKQGNLATTVKQGNFSTMIEQGNETRELKMGNLTVTLDQGNETRALKMGNQSTKLDLGSASTEAMQQIQFKVGQNSLTIDQTGIKLSGMQIQIEGTLMVQMKGAMTTVQGSGMLTLNGGVTMIG
jgi:type VI secretion system secreted protein VgrG